jgi:hypothetical protein
MGRGEARGGSRSPSLPPPPHPNLPPPGGKGQYLTGALEAIPLRNHQGTAVPIQADRVNETITQMHTLVAGTCPV